MDKRFRHEADPLMYSQRLALTTLDEDDDGSGMTGVNTVSGENVMSAEDNVNGANVAVKLPKIALSSTKLRKNSLNQTLCIATTHAGSPCGSFVMTGTNFCFTHSPDKQDAVKLARATGGKNAGPARKALNRRPQIKTLADINRVSSEVVDAVRNNRMTPDVARATVYALALLRATIESRDLQDRIDALEAHVDTASRPRRLMAA